MNWVKYGIMDNNSGGFFILTRRITPFFKSNCDFYKIDSTIDRYDIPELNHLIATKYSKIAAVSSHTKDMTLKMARALLTDRGLLFAQTRERNYPAEFNRSTLDSGFFSEDDEKLAVGQRMNSEILDRLTSAAQDAIMRSASMYPELEQDDELLSRIAKMTMTVLSEIHSLSFFSERFLQLGEDPGYVMLAGSEERKAWISEVKFTLPGRTESVFAEKWLHRKCPEAADDDSMFFFLAFSMPSMVNEAGKILLATRFSSAKSRKRPPVISKGQKDDLERQLNTYLKDDSILAPWNHAKVLLKEYYLYYPVTKYTITDKLDNRVSSLAEPLSKASAAYYDAVGLKERSQPFCDDISTFFSQGEYEYLDSQRQVLLTNPLLLYRIARSPICRNICKSHNKIAKQLCFPWHFDFPIFLKNLDTELNLYSEIVDFCSAGCDELGIPFCEESWRYLWECVEQSVHCLSLAYEDMLSPKVVFKSAYPYFREFFPVLDIWLRKQFSENGSHFEAPLWRAIRNSCTKHGSVKLRENAFEENFFVPYQKLLTSTSPDYDHLKELLGTLAGRFQWNRVRAVPEQEELSKAYEEATGNKLQIESSKFKLFADIIRQAVFSDENARSPGVTTAKEIRMVLCEWVLMNQVCYQAQFKLFEAIDNAIQRESPISSV